MYKQISHNRLAWIDIMRAFSALAVLIYHARAEFWVGMSAALTSASFSFNTFLAFLFAPFSLGWLGVPIFFILSGYSIHLKAARKLANAQSLQFKFVPYIKRRIIRIYPVLIFAIFLTAFLDWWKSDLLIRDYFNENIFYILINLLSLQELFAPAFSFNSVLWTISIELHLYIFYPIILWISAKRGSLYALVIAFIISALSALIYMVFDLKSVFVFAHGGSPLFTSHLIVWVAGAYLADAHQGRSKIPVGFKWHLAWTIFLFIGIILQVKGFWGLSPLFLSVGCLGLVDLLSQIIKKFSFDATFVGLSLEKIGVISYSLYATHRITFEALQHFGIANRSSSLLTALGSCMLAIFMASICFYLIERFSLRQKF